MRYVGVGRRFLALLVDAIIGSIWTYPFLDVQNSPGYFHAQLGGGGFAGSFLITVLYFTLMEGIFGASIGKFAAGIRVVKEDGTKVDIGTAFLRNILRLIDILPGFIPYLIGAILIWTSPTKQRLGDRVAKTVVVEASSIGAGPGGGPPPGAAWVAPAAPGDVAPPPIPPPPPIPGAPGPVTPPPGPVNPPGPVPPADPQPVPPQDPGPASTPDPVRPPEEVPSENAPPPGGPRRWETTPPADPQPPAED